MMGKHDLSFKPEQKDWDRGYVTRERYWELIKLAVLSRGDEIERGTEEEIEGLGYLLCMKSGYIVHHPPCPERYILPKKKRSKSVLRENDRR